MSTQQYRYTPQIAVGPCNVSTYAHEREASPVGSRRVLISVAHSHPPVGPPTEDRERPPLFGGERDIFGSCFLEGGVLLRRSVDAQDLLRPDPRFRRGQQPDHLVGCLVACGLTADGTLGATDLALLPGNY